MNEAVSAPPLRIGMIGAGFIAQVAHLDVFSRIQSCELAFIADARPMLRREVAGRYGIPQQSLYPLEQDADVAVDAFVIALPRRCMGAATSAILDFGKPILGEKPIAHSVDQATKLSAASKSRAAPVLAGHMKRHDPGVKAFRAEVMRARETGEFGQLVHVAMRDYCATYGIASPPHTRSGEKHVERYPEWPMGPDWLPPEQQADYEYTVNVVSHDVNLLRFVLADTLSARSFSVRSGLFQHAALEGPGYTVGIEAGRVDIGAWDQTFEAVFERGTLRLVLPSPLAKQDCAYFSVVRPGLREERHLRHEDRVWAFAAQASHFLDVVRGKARPLTSAEDVIEDLALIEALWKHVSWRPT